MIDRAHLEELLERTVDRARLESLRAEHQPVPLTSLDDGYHCGKCCGYNWPCEQAQILDLALSAGDYLKALVVAQDYADAQRAWQSNQIQLWEYVTQRRDALLDAFPEGHQTLGAALGGTQ